MFIWVGRKSFREIARAGIEYEGRALDMQRSSAQDQLTNVLVIRTDAVGRACLELLQARTQGPFFFRNCQISSKLRRIIRRQRGSGARPARPSHERASAPATMSASCTKLSDLEFTNFSFLIVPAFNCLRR
jgi:hypothetical protein